MLTPSFSIGDSNDGLGRMLEVLRFWFTKDLVCLCCSRCLNNTKLTGYVEIRQREAVQAIQFHLRGVLSSMSNPSLLPII